MCNSLVFSCAIQQNGVIHQQVIPSARYFHKLMTGCMQGSECTIRQKKADSSTGVSIDFHFGCVNKLTKLQLMDPFYLHTVTTPPSTFNPIPCAED